MTFPLLEVEDLIKIIETDTVHSCPYEAIKAILAVMMFAADRESNRTPPPLSQPSSDPVVNLNTLTREEVIATLKFIVVKRLELTYATSGPEVKWGRLATWCLDTLGILVPRVFPDDQKAKQG